MSPPPYATHIKSLSVFPRKTVKEGILTRHQPPRQTLDIVSISQFAKSEGYDRRRQPVDAQIDKDAPADDEGDEAD